MLLPRRYWALLIFVGVLFIGYPFVTTPRLREYALNKTKLQIKSFRWASLKTRYPVTSFIPFPTGAAKPIPQIQHNFGRQSDAEAAKNKRRRDLVKGNFTHAWNGYKTHAWMSDEVAPLTGRAYNHFGGWAATLVDALGASSIAVTFREHRLMNR